MTRTFVPTSWLARLLVLPALCTPLLAGAEESPPNRHMIWQVTGAGGEGWLVGSLHLGRGDMYPLPAVVDEAWERTDELVVELDISAVPKERMRRHMAQAGVYPNDTRLDLHLTPATWERVKHATSRLGVPLVLVQQQRPWLVSVTFSILQMYREGWVEDLGMDRLFVEYARERRPVVELETYEEQIGLLGALAPADQVVMLEATLDDIEREGAAYDSMLDAWRTGDTLALDRLVGISLIELEGGERVYETLFTRRNLYMTQRFEERIASGARPFMVVGAGHLIGDTGVVALLRERGFTVRQASTPAPAPDTGTAGQ